MLCKEHYEHGMKAVESESRDGLRIFKIKGVGLKQDWVMNY